MDLIKIAEEELLDMLRCNDKQFKIKRNGFN